MNSNVNVKRRRQLDPVRMEKLKGHYFRFTNTLAGIREREWAWAASKIDEATRNLRKAKRQAADPEQ